MVMVVVRGGTPSCLPNEHFTGIRQGGTDGGEATDIRKQYAYKRGPFGRQYYTEEEEEEKESCIT